MKQPLLICFLLALATAFFLAPASGSDHSDAPKAAIAHGKTIVDALRAGKASEAVGKIKTELSGSGDFDADKEQKVVDYLDAQQKKYGQFTNAQLVEIAMASQYLQRETWVLISKGSVTRVSFIYLIDKEGTAALMRFQLNTDLWNLPFKRVD